jgi:deoxyribose-phosphate aldolase
MIPDLSHIPSIDQLGVEERVAKFNTRSLKKTSKINALKLALNMIDLTTLEGKDTEGKIKQLCYKALHLSDDLHLPTVAAVCVYPNHVRIAKKALGNSDIKVASVATAFPSGNSNLEIKKQDVLYAIQEGADEIDMVISRGEFLKGNYNYVFDEIASIKKTCGSARLKVIL